MNIRDLHYLVTLADLKHFSKAAEACFVSQPALSMQIKKLEQELGVQLLERHPKAIVMTEIGLLLSERARGILTQVTEFKEMARNAQDPFSGELKLGIFPTLAPYLLPHIIPALNKTYPHLAIYLVEEKSTVLLEQLKQGKLHALLLALPQTDASLTCTPLFDESFLLAIPRQHPFAHYKRIDQTALQHQELLLLEEGHCFRDQALALCQQFSAFDNKKFRATSLETLRHMVMSGVGITLLPKLACHKNPHLRYLPFQQPQPVRTIGFVWRNSSSQTQLLTHIANFLKGLNLGDK